MTGWEAGMQVRIFATYLRQQAGADDLATEAFALAEHVEQRFGDNHLYQGPGRGQHPNSRKAIEDATRRRSQKAGKT